MAEFKRRTLILSSGKQVKLYGNSLAIGKSLEIGEGYAPNIFSSVETQLEGKTPVAVSNPHKLSQDEIMELADYNIQLWMDLKASVRKYGMSDPRIFNQDAVR